MIQRIQTIYLFLASVLTFCLFGVPYAAIGNGTQFFNATVCHLSPAADGISATALVPLAAITLCVAMLCLIAIFLYGNRSRQMKVVKLDIALQLVVLIGMVAYCFGLQKAMGEGFTFAPKFAFAFPIVNAALLFLAFKGIKADDDLVKSADRLR